MILQAWAKDVTFSEQLASYIKEVRDATGREISIAPLAEASEDDEVKGVLELGPSLDAIIIRYTPPLDPSVPAIEKAIAHELTHAHLVYGLKYPIVNAEPETPDALVQKAAYVMDFVDDVLVDSLIQQRGFPATTPEHLAPFSNNADSLEIVKAGAHQFAPPYPDDHDRSEIKWVGDYIYAWGLPRYAKVDAEAQAVLARFARLFPQVLKAEFAKVRGIKKQFLATDIFTPKGRNRVVEGALSEWGLDKQVFLEPIDSA